MGPRSTHSPSPRYPNAPEEEFPLVGMSTLLVELAEEEEI